MGGRSRKLVGAVGLLALVIFWPLLTLALGSSNLSHFSTPVQFAFFIVFGLIWVVPAAILIRWMQRPDRP